MISAAINVENCNSSRFESLLLFPTNEGKKKQEKLSSKCCRHSVNMHRLGRVGKEKEKRTSHDSACAYCMSLVPIVNGERRRKWRQQALIKKRRDLEEKKYDVKLLRATVSFVNESFFDEKDLALQMSNNWLFSAGFFLSNEIYIRCSKNHLQSVLLNHLPILFFFHITIQIKDRQIINS